MKKSGVGNEGAGVSSQKSVDRRRNAANGKGSESGPPSALAADSSLLTTDSSLSDPGPRTLVIGYGNPLRSDDALGWHASRLLAQALAGQEVDVITCHQLTPELAEPLS